MEIDHDELQAKAARLWPGDCYLQSKWIEAVALVRRTGTGWLLDKPIKPLTQGPHDARPGQCQ